ASKMEANRRWGTNWIATPNVEFPEVDFLDGDIQKLFLEIAKLPVVSRPNQIPEVPDWLIKSDDAMATMAISTHGELYYLPWNMLQQPGWNWREFGHSLITNTEVEPDFEISAESYRITIKMPPYRYPWELDVQHALAKELDEHEAPTKAYKAI